MELPRPLPDIRNVRDFGARGDGVRCDADAIQRAIDSLDAPASGPHKFTDAGGEVYFPPGHYLVRKPIQLRVTGLHLHGCANAAFQLRRCTIGNDTAGPVFELPRDCTATPWLRVSDLAIGHTSSTGIGPRGSCGFKLWTGPASTFHKGFRFDNVMIGQQDYGILVTRSQADNDQMAIGLMHLTGCALKFNRVGLYCAVNDANGWQHPIINMLTVRDCDISEQMYRGIDGRVVCGEFSGVNLEGQPIGMILEDGYSQAINVHGCYGEANEKYFLFIRGRRLGVSGNYYGPPSEEASKIYVEDAANPGDVTSTIPAVHLPTE